jgi:hypothetical protein
VVRNVMWRLGSGNWLGGRVVVIAAIGKVGVVVEAVMLRLWWMGRVAVIDGGG